MRLRCRSAERDGDDAAQDDADPQHLRRTDGVAEHHEADHDADGGEHRRRDHRGCRVRGEPRQVGHRRVYTRELLLQHVGDAGFSIEEEWAIGLKPFTLAQMSQLPEAVGVELASGGDLAPEYCAYIGLRGTVAGEPG